MRLTTNIHAVIRFVGDASDPDIELSGPAAEVLKSVLTQIASRQIKRRMEVYIGRTLAECKQGFESSRTSNLEESLEDMFAEIMNLPSNDSEEDQAA